MWHEVRLRTQKLAFDRDFLLLDSKEFLIELDSGLWNPRCILRAPFNIFLILFSTAYFTRFEGG